MTHYTSAHVPLRPTEPAGVHVVLLPAEWQVQFLEADLKMPLPRNLIFSNPEKVWELARRGRALGTSEAGQMLEHATETVRSGVSLKPTAGQYARLKQRPDA